MGEPRISRRRLVGAGAVGAIGVLLPPEAVLANTDGREEVELLRWIWFRLFRARSSRAEPMSPATLQLVILGA